MTLRRIDSFATDEPEKLADQLSRMEDNVDKAVSRAPPKLTFSDWVSSGQPQAQYDQALRVDTSVGAILATLPSVTPETVGRVVAVVRSGANAVTIAPVETAVLIDGATTAVLGAVGLYLYVHDGANWYRY